jgi:hypothetical protein
MVAEDLVRHVATTTGLDQGEAARVVTDVVAYFSESTEEVVRRRHRELKARGVKNDDIWSRIATELSSRVVAAPHLSDRQLRRIVYG